MGSKYEYEEREDSGSGGFTLGLLVGAALGAAAAILFAPKSGYETRSQLRDLADQQKEHLKNQWQQTKTKASQAVDAAIEKVESVAEQTKDVVDTYADKAKGTIDRLADETKATADKFQRRD